jgi:hypothetical protein
MNSVLFRSIAEGTGRRYFDTLSGDIFLVLVKIIRDLDKNNSETSRTNVKSDRFQVFLLIGVKLCYLWSFVSAFILLVTGEKQVPIAKLSFLVL